jgi:tyrosyl-DNA phosphodiesterase 2
MAALIFRSTWQPLDPAQPNGASLPRQTLLKLASWNIDFAAALPGVRAASALAYLELTFSAHPGRIVILLQEMCIHSARQLLETPWIQQNFVVVGYDPAVLSHYFTVMLIPLTLRIANSFRMPFPTTHMGRDALFVDIPLSAPPGSTGSNSDVLRLSTSHLESLDSGEKHRWAQVDLVARRLRERGGDAANVVAGVLGGDMNSILDRECQISERYGLRDAWEDEVPAVHDEGDGVGGAEGHTWGYQSGNTPFPPRRFDKFFYCGSLETVPLEEVPGFGRRVGRFGIGLKAVMPDKESVWASDHFGIAVGIKVGE